MPTIFRTRLNALFAPERHKVWQWVLTGCSLFWIVVVVAVMSIH